MERMNRLALPRRPITDHVLLPRPEGTLPFGLPPRYERLEINAKIPKMWYPDNSIVVSRGKLGEKLYREYPDKAFDLQDPYLHKSPRCDDGLNDPYVDQYVWSPQIYEILLKQKLIAPDGRVKCTLKEMNDYRKYLHNLWALEVNQLRQQEEEESKEMIKILRKKEQTPEEKKKLKILMERRGRSDPEYNPEFFRRYLYHLEQPLDDPRFLVKPPLPMCLAERMLSSRKRVQQAKRRNLKELDDWLSEQSKYLRNVDAQRQAAAKKMEARMLSRWLTHCDASQIFLEEEEKLWKRNDQLRIKNQEERDQQIQQHRERQHRRLQAMQMRRRRMIDRQNEAVRRRFLKMDQPVIPLARAVSSPTICKVSRTMKELDRFLASQPPDESASGDTQLIKERKLSADEALVKTASELAMKLVDKTLSEILLELTPGPYDHCIHDTVSKTASHVVEYTLSELGYGTTPGPYDHCIHDTLSETVMHVVDSTISIALTEISEEMSQTLRAPHDTLSETITQIIDSTISIAVSELGDEMLQPSPGPYDYCIGNTVTETTSSLVDVTLSEALKEILEEDQIAENMMEEKRNQLEDQIKEEELERELHEGMLQLTVQDLAHDIVGKCVELAWNKVIHRIHQSNIESKATSKCIEGDNEKHEAVEDGSKSNDDDKEMNDTMEDEKKDIDSDDKGTNDVLEDRSNDIDNDDVDDFVHIDSVHKLYDDAVSGSLKDMDDNSDAD